MHCGGDRFGAKSAIDHNAWQKVQSNSGTETEAFENNSITSVVSRWLGDLSLNQVIENEVLATKTLGHIKQVQA